MCLTNVTEKYSENTKEVVGYKVFQSFGEDLLSEFFPTKDLPLQVWLHEKRFRDMAGNYDNLVCTETGEMYDTGWHLFERLKDANVWCGFDQKIYRCRGRNIAARGKEKEKSVVVCKELFIVRKIKTGRIK